MEGNEPMKRQFFGTDGVRGVANGPLLTPHFVLALGQAAARILPSSPSGFVLIGRDSRISGTMLEAALVAGLQSVGRDTGSLGVVPTPAVSYLTAQSKADFGVVISASHNPVPDNGIKFFDSQGYKLAEEVELAIEAELLAILAGEERSLPTGTAIATARDVTNLMEDYCQHLVTSIPTLQGMHIVCDAAWGAAAPWAEQVLRKAGAKVQLIHAEAKGDTINLDCGSTNPRKLQELVVAQGADLGLAFDGDADRLIAIAETGQLIDGDCILYILGVHLNNSDYLTNHTVVGTIMSNLGLEKAFGQLGIHFVRADVGDRYVWEEMKVHQAILGGEQSGHIINSRWATTGDGLLNGLQLAAVVKESGGTLSDLISQLPNYPQKLINVRVADKQVVMNSPILLEAKKAVEEKLQGKGRIVLRPSGTQDLIRVMAEAVCAEMALAAAEEIAEVVRSLVKQS